MNRRAWSWLAVLVTGQAMALQAIEPPQPVSQVHTSADAQLQASVRKAIENDASLSDAGHHVTVIVVDSAVVLRGLVKDDKEKLRIETVARQVGGVREVTNELDVKP